MSMCPLSLVTLVSLLLPAPVSIFLPPPPTPHLAPFLLAQTTQNRKAEADQLFNQGIQQAQTSQFEAALQSWQQALQIYREIHDRQSEGAALGNLGIAYINLGNYAKAIEYEQQALAITREIGDRESEGIVLNNLGAALVKQKQPELAIVFYKQSVKVRESIRQDIHKLPREQQESYTQTVAGTYRRLADLLLKQDRVLEAQQVLDLLKVQELKDYLRNVRGTGQQLENLPKEQQFWAEYDAKLAKIVKLGQELADLEARAKTVALSPAEIQRKAEIEQAQRTVTGEFLSFIRSQKVAAIVQQLSKTTAGENLNPKLLKNLQDNLRELQQNAVVLYPLVLDDRVELLMATPNAPPIRRPVPVKREELNRAILEFRQALVDPTQDAKAPAQKLYNWLIKPLEPALKEANAKTIIYAPDGQLRYIPLAALHDGNQWLVQRFQVNNITALSLTDLGKTARSLKVLATAYTQKGKNHSIQVGNHRFPFTGLKFAGQEVETLAETIPGTTKLLDDNFSLKVVLQQMSNFSILHFATHAAFLKGQPEESFILFGNGDLATFRDVETWNLPNTDLVVLSACETGVGNELGNGKEILGFGYLMQQAGARAAISSLWSVDDGGTQALMDAFYTLLQKGNITKAEALRQAQITLITKNSTAIGQKRGGVNVEPLEGALPQIVIDRLDHPYYWAPFILIGNGL